MFKHLYWIVAAFLISTLPCSFSWGQVPQTQPTQSAVGQPTQAATTQPTQVAVAQPTQLIVTPEKMDDVSRQIVFSFSEKVIPELDDLKAVLEKPAQNPVTEQVSETKIQEAFRKLKESLLSKKKKVLSDDEMDALLKKQNATEADMRLMIDKIKAYIISKVSFSPSLNGSFVWSDAQHLVFIPEPNQINLWENEINVQVGAIRPYFGKEFTSDPVAQALTAPAIRKVSNFQSGEEGPQFIAYLGNKQYSNFIGKGPYFLLYSQKVGSKELAKYLVLSKADGSKAAYSIRIPAAGEDAFDTAGIDLKNVVGVVLDEKLDEGDHLVLSIPSWKGKPSETEPDITKVNLVYRTAFKLKDLSFEGKRPSGKMGLRSSVIFHFSSSFRGEVFRKALQILPAPEWMNVNERGAGTVEVRLKLTGGMNYSLGLKDSFRDIQGNPLEEPVNVTFTAQDLSSSLEVPGSPLVVEPNHISIPFKGLNLKSVDVQVYEFASALDYLKARNTPGRQHSAADFGLTKSVLHYSKDLSGWPANKLVSDGVVLDKAALQDSKVMKVIDSLLPAGAAVPEGFKCVEFDAQGGGSEKGDFKGEVLADVTDIGMTAKASKNEVLVWLASFASGKVLPGIPVKLVDSKGTLLGEGTSDDKGVAVIKPKAQRVLAGDRTLYLVAGDRSVLALKDKEMSSAWQFNLPGATDVPDTLRGSVFTERGVYRPGEKVYIKAYVRANGAGKLNLSVKDPRAKEVFSAKVKPDAYGSADFQFDLPQEGAVGRYDIILSSGSSNLTQSFQVQEYRVPTFLVSVDDEGRKWVNKEPVNLEVASKYYHGGAMGGRSFTWQITRTFAPLNLKDFPGYIFQSAEDETASGDFANGEGTLNEAGKQIVTFRPQQELSAGRMKYTFEAVVTDNDNQAYSSRVSGMVSPAEVFVGLKPPAKEVVSSNTAVKIPFVVVDGQGGVQAGRTVDVRVERMEYHQTARQYAGMKVQMLNRMVGQTLLTQSFPSGTAPKDFEYTPPQAGIYRFSFDSSDAQGNKARTSTYLLVAGTEAIAWPRFDIEKIDIVKDKDNYKIGETAHLVPQTPYKDATGLLTLEVNGVLSTRIVEIHGDTPEIQVPITADDAPNVYVSLVLVRGRQHFKTDALGFETGAPGFKIGYVNLVVYPSDKRLQVVLDRSLESVSPGQKVTLPVSVVDYNHAGTQSQLTAMVVDEAVLDMTGYTTPNPLESIYKLRPLGVRNGANWLDMPHSRRERLESLFAPGDAQVGLGDRSDLEGVLRNLFKSTAYWNPNLVTDAQGKATITFTMPDNLTTYRVMVVAADKKGCFGSADHRISTQKPLMVQPVLPRFLYPEDQLEVGAMVFNNTPQPAEVALKADFEGVSLVAGLAEKKVTVAPGQSAKVTFEVKAGPSGTAVFRFAASTPSHKDAGEYKIPVRDPGTSVTEVKSVKVDNGGTVALKMPDHFVKGTAKAEIGLSVTKLTELRGAVQYLMQYPNGCIEQTTSTAYPLVVLKDLLPVIGVDVDQGDLKKFSEAGVSRILSFQTAQGGLSYWPGGTEPHAFGTAFGLTALIEAKKRGYNVPDKALAGMADYLELALRSGKITGEMPHEAMADADTRALFVMTLGRLGRPQPQYINALWDNRKEMTPFGLSMLAIAVKEMKGGDQSLLEPILKAVKDAATEEKNQAYYAGKPEGGYSLGSPLRTHAAALLAYGKTGGDAEMTGKLMEGFLARREGEMWGNTQENVFGIMGIYESAGKAPGKSLPNASLSLNGKDVPFTSMEAPDNQVRRISYSEDELALKAGDPVTADLKGDVSGGVLTLRLSYELPLDYADFSAKSEGLTVTRTYETPEGKEVDLNAIPLGGLVKVRLKVETGQQYNYVALEDKVPAGLEPLNKELETTQNVQQGELTMEEQKGTSVLSYQEVRDHRVAFFMDDLAAGSYEFSYIARATSPGTFLRPAAQVEPMYATDHFGKTATDKVTVK